MMQSASFWIGFIASWEWTNSRSGYSSKPGSSHGRIERTLLQNGSMSTTRSLRTGRLPIGAIVGTWPASTIGFMRSRQARIARPSMRIPQEPQIIIRQLFR